VVGKADLIPPLLDQFSPRVRSDRLVRSERPLTPVTCDPMAGCLFTRHRGCEKPYSLRPLPSHPGADFPGFEPGVFRGSVNFTRSPTGHGGPRENVSLRIACKSSNGHTRTFFKTLFILPT
jgi:hypothetical protein